ncbi:uncharacterized protein LOC108597604 isoform X5 [Drosophila busckii]|uniref:uncharacterized protein LOC108597604 isoform X5 n=1 Tax=Drosophila busckii TaxID=30019 RepID=UPI00083EC675|nr:uncharacterized protein LOC108597604 isoform X5 [Drosophila busckii]
MSLTTNLVLALGFLFAALIISQLIFLAKRMHQSRLLNRQRQQRQQRARLDRQNTAELGRQHNNYADIFYIEPNSPEAARIREQLEKDDKELPSYDEVMRMCNLTSPTAAAAPTSALPAVAVTPMDSGPIGIAALPAPPYSELDPHTSPVGAPVAITISALETAPSTSRAAQTPT